MAIGSVVSTLPDPKWVAAVEKELQNLRDENASLKLEVAMLRRVG